MKKSDRQLACILLLQDGRCLTAQRIAEHFEVCKRTVYRDIQALSEAGVPVISLPGQGYKIMDTYYLPPVRLTIDEATALYIGSRFALRQTDASLRPDLNSGMLKIESVLPPETKNQLARLKESIHLEERNNHRPAGETKFLATISSAIIDRRLMQVQYRAFYSDELTERTVEPLWLLYYSFHWHLIAYCRLREDLRDFRIDRIQWLEKLEESFPERAELSLQSYLKQHARYQEISEVKVKFTKQAARYAREWFHWISYTEEDLGDYVIITFLLENPWRMSWWLLSFGAEAEVLSPESLREHLWSVASHIAALYEPAREHVEPPYFAAQPLVTKNGRKAVMQG
jgi:predicted DNA-binding transcriptional regulator YafY